MRIRTAIAVATLLPATFAFGVATSDEDGTCRVDEDRTITIDGEDVPVEYCETSLFAQCGAAVGGKVIIPNEAVKLEPTAPTESFTAGGGCGTVDEPVFASQSIDDAMYQFATSGFAAAGSVDSLTFEAYFLGPNLAYAGEDLHFDMRFTVDGVSLFGTDTGPDATGQGSTTAPSFVRVVAPGTVSDSGASVGVEFTITGLDELLPAREPGEFRQVAVSFGPPHTGQCQTLPTNTTPRCAPSGFSGWVLGAVEVPSGVTFNPAEPAATTIAAIVEDEA